MPTDQEWNEWLFNIKNEALDYGISQNTIYKHYDTYLNQMQLILFLTEFYFFFLQHSFLQFRKNY